MNLDHYKIEHEEDWRGWVDKIPFLKFPISVEWKVIPPFVGAIARFLVRVNGKTVSVYLDCYDRLGVFGAPILGNLSVQKMMFIVAEWKM